MLSTPSCLSASADLRARRVSSVSLVQHCLAQIDRYESRIHAWVRVDREGVLRQAEQCDLELRQGHDRGPLHGLPLGIKDIIDVAGMPTEAGSPLRRGQIATQDAPLVAKLRSAGAIILGKTVTTEFAGFDPPPTHNPWNLDRTPGGSSSGSAAAVALGMCLAAIGTQTGGSIIRPASFCGIVGFKPAQGAVSLSGIVPISVELDHPGPMTRSLADAHALYRVIGEANAPGVGSTLIPAAPRRLGRLVGAWIEAASSDVRGTLNTAVSRLAATGVEVVDVELPASFADMHRCHRQIMAHDYYVGHRESWSLHRDQYGPKVGSMIDEGSRISDTEYAAALAHQRAFRRELAEHWPTCDALVMSSTVTVAPGLDSTGDPRFNSPWSYTGYPCVTLPCGLGEAGLPVGLQLIALPEHTERLFNVSAWCEQALGFDKGPVLE